MSNGPDGLPGEAHVSPPGFAPPPGAEVWVDGVLVQPGDAEIPTEVEETPSIDKVIAFWENATGLIGGTTVSVQLTNGKTIKSTVKDVIIKDMVIVGVILDGGSKANERTYVPWHAVSFVRVH